MENNTESSMLGKIEEERAGDSDQRQELEEIIGTVPYSLSIALIKVTILNNYEPLEIEKYYEKIKPAFHLLRRSDGSKYTTTSLLTVRSAMVSNRLYFKNKEGLYVLDVPNAIKVIKLLKKKKNPGEGDSNDVESEQVTKPKSRKENPDTNTNIGDIVSIYKGLRANINEEATMTGKKRKLRKIKKTTEVSKKGIEKFEKAFNLLKNLLRVTSNDRSLYAQLNFDFSEMKDSALGEGDKLNVDKIIGMLKVFKFFKPFLERCFNSIELQENIMCKISELNSEIYFFPNNIPKFKIIIFI